MTKIKVLVRCLKYPGQIFDVDLDWTDTIYELRREMYRKITTKAWQVQINSGEFIMEDDISIYRYGIHNRCFVDVLLI